MRRSFDSTPDPRRVEAGREAARRRWGVQRIIDIRDLTPEARRLVLALVDAAKKEAAAEGQSPAAATPEGTRDAVPAT